MMIWFATIVYILFVMACTCLDGAILINGKSVDSYFARFAIAVVFFPAFGFLLWLGGWVGRFMLLPFVTIISQLW